MTAAAILGGMVSIALTVEQVKQTDLARKRNEEEMRVFRALADAIQSGRLRIEPGAGG